MSVSPDSGREVTHGYQRAGYLQIVNSAIWLTVCNVAYQMGEIALLSAFTLLII